MDQNLSNLIYGKSQVQRVVGLEVCDNQTEIFKQDERGTINCEIIPNEFWLLSPTKLTKDFKSLKGNLHYKWGIKFNTQKEMSNFRYSHRDYDLFVLWDKEESFMVKQGYGFFQGMKHNEVSILSFDIETNTLNPDDKDALVVLISTTARDSKGNIYKHLFSYDDYANQKDMLDDFSLCILEFNPTILCGHNIFGFDVWFMNTIACKNNTKLNWGRNGSAVSIDKKESKFRKDGSQFYHYYKAHCYGRTFIDTMFLAIKYDVGRKYESYGLKPIIKHEGLEKADRVFYDAAKIRDNYKDPEEMKKIKEYAKDDADDALALYDLMIPSYFYMTQAIPKTFQNILLSATGSPINSIMVRAYLQENHSIPKADEVVAYEGAISYGVPGVYDNSLKIDVASLYPSIMMEYSVFCEEKDPKGYFLELTIYFTLERLKNKEIFEKTKDRYYDDLQRSQKIVASSLYGFMGAAGLNFNFPEGAAAVTRIGREILQYAIEWASGKKYERLDQS